MDENLNRKEYYDRDEIYQKSNLIISSKFKSTITENRLMAIALSQLKHGSVEDAAGSLVINISATTLKEKLGLKGESLYTSLETIANKLAGRVIGMTDRENQRFVFVPLVTMAKYENGVFTIRFVPEMKRHLLSENRFTLLSLPVMLSLKSNYSFRLFEILKSRCYHEKHSTPSEPNKYAINFLVSELKLEMGVINPEVGAIKTFLSESKGIPDYDRAVESAKEQMFVSYSIFKRDCLDKAVKEINEKTELRVSYEGKRVNGSRKVNQVVFYVEVLQQEEKSEQVGTEAEKVKHDSAINIPANDKFKVLDEIYDIITEKIKPSLASKIAQVANFDIERIRKAYAVYKANPKADGWGFLIDAIKYDYDMPEQRSNGAAGFKNFDERDTDYDTMFAQNGVEEK